MPGCSSLPNLNHRWSGGGAVRHSLHPTLLLHRLSPLLASSHPYLHVQVPPSSLSGCTDNRLSNSRHFLRSRYVPDIMLRWRSICLSLCPFTHPSRQTDKQIDRQIARQIDDGQLDTIHISIHISISIYIYINICIHRQEKEMATHSSILAWKIPMDRGAWQLQSMGRKSQT